MDDADDDDFEQRCEACDTSEHLASLRLTEDGWFCTMCLSCGAAGCGVDGAPCLKCIEEDEDLMEIENGATVH